MTELHEKLKVETDTCTKLRKQAAELGVAKASNERMAIELQTMLTSLQLNRDTLNEELATLQGQLSQEKSSLRDLQIELEGKLKINVLNIKVKYLNFLFKISVVRNILSINKYYYSPFYLYYNY